MTGVARDRLAVPASEWRSTLVDEVGRGGRFAGLFADGPHVRAVLRDGGRWRLLEAATADGHVPSVVADIPAAAWDEREAADLGGVVFDGHTPCRPLVHHPEDPLAWVTPVVGEDVIRIPVGPIHAGVIESGHFLFGAVGERVMHLDVRLFHKHRGLENAARGGPPHHALQVLGHACAACAVSNAVAVCGALEEARGLMPDADLRRQRTLLVELERLWNHLNDTGQVCAGVGLAPGAMLFASLKERAQRVCALLTGHRFMFRAVGLDGGIRLPDTGVLDRARAEVAGIAREAAEAARVLLFDASLRDRTSGVGTLDARRAARLGVVGPAARAAGVPVDARIDDPRLWYPDFAVVHPADPRGDVAARLEARWVETWQCAEIIDALLADPPRSPGAVHPHTPPGAFGVGAVESPRGESVCVARLDGDGTVARIHLRTASYANWPAVAEAATRAILPDFPLVNKSFELCYACVDR